MIPHRIGASIFEENDGGRCLLCERCHLIRYRIENLPTRSRIELLREYKADCLLCEYQTNSLYEGVNGSCLSLHNSFDSPDAGVFMGCPSRMSSNTAVHFLFTTTSSRTDGVSNKRQPFSCRLFAFWSQDSPPSYSDWPQA